MRGMLHFASFWEEERAEAVRKRVQMEGDEVQSRWWQQIYWGCKGSVGLVVGLYMSPNASCILRAQSSYW